MVTTASNFASSGFRHGATVTAQAAVAGAQADVRGTLAAVHFRDEHGFAIFSLEQPDGSRIRAIGYLPPTITLRADVRIAGTWTQQAQYVQGRSRRHNTTFRFRRLQCLGATLLVRAMVQFRPRRLCSG